jgi:hypothetical protein
MNITWLKNMKSPRNMIGDGIDEMTYYGAQCSEICVASMDLPIRHLDLFPLVVVPPLARVSLAEYVPQ